MKTPEKITNKSETCIELLELIDQQEQMIAKQDDIIARLVNENVEQENMINILMQEHLDE